MRLARVRSSRRMQQVSRHKRELMVVLYESDKPRLSQLQPIPLTMVNSSPGFNLTECVRCWRSQEGCIPEKYILVLFVVRRA